MKTVVMLEEGVEVLRHWTAKCAMAFQSHCLFRPVMGPRLEGQDVIVIVLELVAGAQILDRRTAGLVSCSEWEAVVCPQWEPVTCLEAEPVFYHTILQNHGHEVVAVTDRRPVNSVMSDASGRDSSQEDYTSHH